MCIRDRNKSGWVVDHEHGRWRHPYLISSHGNHCCSTGGDAVDLNRDFALIFFKHGVDLTGGKKITPWGIDPDGDVTGICF